MISRDLFLYQLHTKFVSALYHVSPSSISTIFYWFNRNKQFEVEGVGIVVIEDDVFGEELGEGRLLGLHHRDQGQREGASPSESNTYGHRKEIE